MPRMTLLLAALLSQGLVAGVAWAADSAGGVTQKKGESTGTIEGEPKPIGLGALIFLKEQLATGAEARLEVTFLDATQLTLGEKATVTIDRFVYDPGKARLLEFAATGALRFISGKDKSRHSDVTFTTPVVVIGARGTDFWFGPIDGQFGVLALEGVVTVSNSAGRVVLDQPGEGTNIAGPGARPGPVTHWPQQKVDRALAAVAF